MKIFKTPTTAHILLVCQAVIQTFLCQKWAVSLLHACLAQAMQYTVIHFIWAAGFHLVCVLETPPTACNIWF